MISVESIRQARGVEVLCDDRFLIDRPLLSICVVTYNHQRYISECLKSILNQETSYSFELIIGDDNSKDETWSICHRVFKENPEKVKLVRHSGENKIKIDGKPTGRFNFFYNLSIARGKYIALIDGDDYWIDTLKLRKQVDFLEANPDYSLCAHNVKVIYEGQADRESRFIRDPKNFGTSTAEDILRKIYIHTSSMVFRNKEIEFPDFAKISRSMDVLLQYQLTRDGSKVYTFEEVMSIYRKHPGGISNLFNSQLEICRDNIAFQNKYYLPFVEKRHRRIVHKNTLDFKLRLIELLREGSKWFSFFKEHFKLIPHLPYWDKKHSKYWFAYCAFPSLYKKIKRKSY